MLAPSFLDDEEEDWEPEPQAPKEASMATDATAAIIDLENFMMSCTFLLKSGIRNTIANH